MTESQSDAAHETAPSGDAINSDATTKLPVAVSQDTATVAEAGGGSPHRSRWLPPTAGGTARVADPGPGSRPLLGQKSAWILGGVIGVAILSVALSATARLSLSSGKTPITMSAAASSASPRASVPSADAGKVLPLVSKPARARQVPSGARPTRARPTGALPTGAPTRSGKTVSPPLPLPSASPAVSASRAVPATAPAQEVTPGSHPATTTPASAAPGTAGTPVTTPEPKSVSWWALNDDDSESIAQDSDGANPALGANIVWCGAAGGSGNCSTFNGTSSAFTTSGPVLNTGPGSSFTVSANVFMTGYNTADDSFETIVSQDAAANSGFYLQYSGADQRWAFARVVSDTDGAAGIRALSTSGPALNTWTHLVGVFDASDDQLRLYVNGALEGIATDTTPFAATGPLVIGRGQFGGQPTDWFNGAANQIQVWNVALTSAEVANIPM